MPNITAPVWAESQLDAERITALGLFVAAWGAEGTHAYETQVREFSQAVRALFVATDDLTDLNPATFVDHPELLHVARFVTAPPVSADDLHTLLGGSIGVRQPNLQRASQAARIIRAAWDPVRFPWLVEGRAATETERAAAIPWTASIWAIERLRTARRNTSSRAEEQRVSAALASAGFSEVSRRPIQTLDDLTAAVSRAR